MENARKYRRRVNPEKEETGGKGKTKRDVWRTTTAAMSQKKKKTTFFGRKLGGQPRA